MDERFPPGKRQTDISFVRSCGRGERKNKNLGQKVAAAAAAAAIVRCHKNGQLCNNIMELVLANWRPTKRTMLPKQHFASTATTTATANLLLCTWLVIFLLAVTMGTAMAEWHEKCPSGCLCDQEASLVSCGGEDEDEDQVGSSDQRNETIQPKLPLDEVWKAAGLVQRLDLRDAPVERLESAQLNGTSSLRELSLVRCNLSGIGASAFARQDQLERLDLSQNLLAVLTQVTIESIKTTR